MREKDDIEFIQVMLVAAMVFIGIFSFSIAKSYGAPWAVAVKFVLSSVAIGLVYCVYAWVRYGFMRSPVHTSYYNYHYNPSWYHYIRIWPLAILGIFVCSFDMLDNANTVTYIGIASQPKHEFLFDGERAWYTLWYSKLMISISIVVVAHIVHHTLASWLRRLFD
ncbi:hypothetical protein GCM10007938_26500 [Vibrio zhanjiangensis]|uniref:Uncharacterized protein n=1 Tax=Vibrio zhanjiangensis TaxID=1046128 RepID=A0ABQ6F047_9VIBR|nr:hypothetical protein GCM10007938_26500 [Vibrio zhanjiangensis]